MLRTSVMDVTSGRRRLNASMTTNQDQPRTAAVSAAIGPVIRAGHPRLAVLTALGLALTEHLIHRSTHHVIFVFLTVLVGGLILGWHNDLTDERDDRHHDLRSKPLVSGAVTAQTLWIVLSVAGFLLVLLAPAVGLKAGMFYVGSVLVAMAGNVVLRTGAWSWASWAVSYALFVPYLSFSSSAAHPSGSVPGSAMVACFALIGIGIHVAVALWGLVADDADGWTYLPLQLGRRFGASQAMAMVIFYLAGVGVAVAYVGHTHGFGR